MTLPAHSAVSALTIGLGGLLALVSSAHGDQVRLAPTKDNTIYAESNNLSNGAGPGLFAGVTKTGAIRRSLLAFDVASAIPAGSTITSAQLVLQVTMSTAGVQEMTVHRLLADWGEGTSNAGSQGGQGASATTGDASWRSRFFDTQTWKTKGGDFVAKTSATQDAPDDGAVTWGSTDQLVADVQGWVDGTNDNFGWIVLGDEDHQQTTKRFASRESSKPTDRPMLVIKFEPAAGAATATPTSTATSTQTRTVAPSATSLPTQTAAPTATAKPTQTLTVPATATIPPTALPTTPTASAAMSGTPAPTETPVPATVAPTATAATTGTATPTNTAVPATVPPTRGSFCTGDCDDSATVSINELITGVNIALGTLSLNACPAFDPSGNGKVEINELIAAVSNALNECA